MPRPVRLLVAVGVTLSALSVLAAPAVGTPLPSPTNSTGPSATVAANPIQIRLTSIAPVAPQPGDTLVVSAIARNVSASPISGLGGELLMGGTVTARSTFDAYADSTGGDVLNQGLSLVAPLRPLPLSTLAPGKQESFQISVPVNNLNLPTNAWQVHELGIAVDGATSLGGSAVGALRTFLPWAPRTASLGLNPIQLAWLWPLIDRPHRGVTATWFDDNLSGELATTGRLGRLVAAAATAAAEGTEARNTRRTEQEQLNSQRRKHHHVKLPAVTTRNVPVTWAIDPMLIDDINTMRTPYQVAGSSKPTTGKGSAAARSFLAQLRSAVGTSDVVPLPYADPDVTAAVRDNLGTLIGVAATTGRRLLSGALPNADLLDQTGWPAGGFIDERGVNSLYSDDITNLLLSTAALPPRVPPSATPTAHTSLATAAGPISVLLTDSKLSTAVTIGASPGAQPFVALQRFLAETLMIETEAPGEHRSLVVAPGRRWSPSPQYAAALLADTGKVPWLTPVSLQQVIDSPIDTSVPRDPLTFPSTARRAQLPRSYVDQIAAINRDTAEFASILASSPTETRPYGTAVLRALSTAWRGNPTARSAQLDAVRRSLQAEMASVHIATHPLSFITLTSHGGKLPVTIANDLDAPVNITVQLDANQRLTFSHGGQVSVSIPAHQHVAVSIKASAKTSGVFPLEVHLLTPGGKQYGESVKLFVRSTVYGTITLVITGAATAALLIAVAIRLTRRALSARRQAATAP